MGALAALVMSYYVVNSLGPAESGMFFLVFAVLNVMVPLNLFGCQMASIKYVGKASLENNKKKLLEICISLTSIVFISALIFSSILWLLSEDIAIKMWQKVDASLPLKLMAAASLFTSLSFVIAYILQAMGKSALSIVIISIISPVGCILVLLFTGVDTALGLAKLFLILSIINFVFSVLSLIYSLDFVGFSVRSIQPILQTCWPLWITSVANVLGLLGGQLVSGIYVDTEEISHLAIAQRASMLISFVLIVVNMIVSPNFGYLFENNKLDELQALVTRTFNVTVRIALPVLTVFILFNGSILGIFGEGYDDYGYLLAIMAIGQIVNVLTGPVGYLLNTTGHEKDMTYISLIVSPVTIIVTIYLVKYYGVSGAAIGTAVAVSAQNVVAAYFVRKRLNIITFRFKV